MQTNFSYRRKIELDEKSISVYRHKEVIMAIDMYDRILDMAKREAVHRGVASFIANDTESFIRPIDKYVNAKMLAFERLHTAANGDSARYVEIKQSKNQLKEYLRDVKFYSEQSASIIVNDLDVNWLVEHVEKGLQGSMLASIGKCYRECTKQEFEYDCSILAQTVSDCDSESFNGKRWDLENGNILVKRGNVENANV